MDLSFFFLFLRILMFNNIVETTNVPEIWRARSKEIEVYYNISVLLRRHVTKLRKFTPAKIAKPWEYSYELIKIFFISVPG